MSAFDNIQRAAFTMTQQVYGDVATWVKSDGSGTLSEKVLFKNPNDPIHIGETDRYEYRPFNYSFEYLEGQLAGLKQSVESSGSEVVTVNGFELIIRQVIAKFDGKTLTAYGELKTPEIPESDD